MILKKVLPYIINFNLPTSYEMDIRNSNSATWADILYAVMKDKGQMSLNELYDELKDCKKCKENIHWKEKIRQTLQRYKFFISNNRGIWEAA